MLPHRRLDPSLKSNSVSRVGSSTRLNHLAQDAAVLESSPSTPSAYVTSSLNPSRNLPATTTTATQAGKTTRNVDGAADAFSRLPIAKNLQEFRVLLDKLSDNVMQFRDDQVFATVEELAQVNTALENDIDELSKHKQRRRTIDELKRRNESLDETLKSNLKQLLKYRGELKKLPKIKNEDPMELHRGPDVSVENILNYSMKLAKFTKAPAAMGNMPLQIHPNNFVWPAEDSLRRGMLALSSIQGEEIIRNILGVEETGPEENIVDTHEGDSESLSEVKNKLGEPGAAERKNSHSFGVSGEADTSTVEREEESQPGGLDLDLFDPDDELSD
ncbi:uncharacterized protein LODBEIA_P37050 [Lodderomyces beijingensis]|uniref:Mediator of RNA polymerase II transcription subunit 4 n=1 Tax=Lodderomyces beijingensis TaxID=1775926 RepID=A0ABP0ZRF1_9ASCO